MGTKLLLALALLCPLSMCQTSPNVTVTFTGFGPGSGGAGTITIVFCGEPNTDYDGFLALKNGDGNIVYTLSGPFTTDSEGKYTLGPISLTLAPGDYKLTGNIAKQGTTPSTFIAEAFTVSS